MTRRRLIGGLLAIMMTASVMLTGCGGINPSATVATMGETKISMGMANFMLRLQQASYDTYYRSYFGDDMWSSDLSGSAPLFQSGKNISCLKGKIVLDKSRLIAF